MTRECEMSEIETTFLFYWRVVAPKAPQPDREYRFHPERRWRFDFAFPAHRVAVECEGGTWVQGRHTRGLGFRNDCEKYNAATARGWRVYRCTAGMLQDDPGGFVEIVKKSLKEK